jgi:hypothetical protein
MSGAHDRFFSDRSRVFSGRDHLSGPSQCVEDTWQKPARPAPAVALQFATACRFAAAVSAAIAQPTPGVPACGSMATAAHWSVNVPTKAQFDLAGGLASFEVWHLDKAWPFALCQRSTRSKQIRKKIPFARRPAPRRLPAPRRRRLIRRTRLAPTVRRQGRTAAFPISS